MTYTELHAILPHPVGVNQTYRAGAGCVYKTSSARQWERDALLLLRAAGWRTLPSGEYWLAVRYTVWTCRLDVDAPIKAVVDAAANALGIDDRAVGAVMATKIPVRSRADQRLELRCLIRPVADKTEWTDVSLAVQSQALGRELIQ